MELAKEETIADLLPGNWGPWKMFANYAASEGYCNRRTGKPYSANYVRGVIKHRVWENATTAPLLKLHAKYVEIWRKRINEESQGDTPAP